MLRWSDMAVWEGPTPNSGPAMNPHSQGLVVHIAAGYYKGTISWQKDPDNNVSSHFVVAGPRDLPYGVPDGKLAQVVDLDVAAWTQQDGNGEWHSIECSGFLPDKLSPAQVETIAKVYARGMRELGWPNQLASNPVDRGLAFHGLSCATVHRPYAPWVVPNTTGQHWGHCDCPGQNIINQLPGILGRAVEINGGDDDMPRFVRDARNKKVWVSSGPVRYHIPDQVALNAALAAWGHPTLFGVDSDAELAGFGVDVATLTGGGSAPADVDVQAVYDAAHNGGAEGARAQLAQARSTTVTEFDS